jgi:uncharacterized protein YndB with AHSA1/START domain
MGAARSDVTAISDREIRITRVFDAPRTLVFEAWTDPAHVAHGWGPAGFTVTTHQIEVRPGGLWRFVMHGPDGVDYDNQIVYLEIVRPERLVYTHGSGKADDPDDFQVTATFDEHDGQTRLTMQMLFPSAEVRDRTLKEYGALEGANQTLDRLAAYSETGSLTSMSIG